MILYGIVLKSEKFRIKIQKIKKKHKKFIQKPTTPLDRDID